MALSGPRTLARVYTHFRQLICRVRTCRHSLAVGWSTVLTRKPLVNLNYRHAIHSDLHEGTSLDPMGQHPWARPWNYAAGNHVGSCLTIVMYIADHMSRCDMLHRATLASLSSPCTYAACDSHIRYLQTILPIIKTRKYNLIRKT